MAYKPLDLKITPGGLNLLAPGDQVADGDCLDLTGFWPGAAGRLEQAPGYTHLSDAHLPNSFDGLCQASGRTYFSDSAAGTLFEIGRAAEAAIDTGFDTYPLGMISAQGYLWIMNRAKQRKDDGTTVTDWTPAAPAPPTVTLLGTIVGASNADPIVIDTGAVEHGVIDGQAVTIADVVGNTAANGSFFGKKTGYSLTTFALYSDAGLTTTVAASGAYVSGGQLYAGGLAAGSYDYYVTWQYKDLGESNPSTVVTIVITTAGSYVSIDITALTPPTGATGWNIYRKSQDLATPFRLNEGTLDIVRKFVYDYGDTIHRHDDEYLVNGIGAELETDHGSPPAARIVADQLYNGRIVVANTAANPNRVFYTPSLQPAFFRGADNPQAGDWVDVGTDSGDEIRYMAVRPQMIIVYRAKSIWRILYDFEDPNGRVEVVVPDLGIVGPRAVVATSLGDYFRSPEGIHRYGDWAQKVSTKLDPIFLGKDAEPFLAENPTYQSKCALGFHAGRLWVSLTFGGGTSNNQSFVYHVETARWFPSGRAAGAFLDIGTNLLAAGLTYVNTLESGYSSAGNNSVVRYQSAYEDAGMPDHEKTWADLVINHNTGGETLTIFIRTNKNATADDAFTLDTTFTSSSLTKTIVPLVYPANYSIPDLQGKPIRSFTLSVVFDGTGPLTAPPLTIDTPLILHYYLEARKGLVFDTDETDHGMPGVTKTVDMVEFDVDASDPFATVEAGEAQNTFVLQIYSDIPGATMAPRLGAGIAMAGTTGRQVVRIVLAEPIDGKLLRYVATTGSGIGVYGFRARITPIGVHLDGTVGDTWDTRPIPIAG